MQPEECHASYFKYHPSQSGSESEGDAEATEDLNLEDPLELGPEVTCFLQGPAEKFRRGEYEGALSQTSNRRVGEVSDMESSGI